MISKIVFCVFQIYKTGLITAAYFKQFFCCFINVMQMNIDCLFLLFVDLYVEQ